MTGSYMVILTAFLADNGKNLPLADRLPTAAFWPLPAAIAAPLIAWSLRRHRGPEPAAGPAPAAGTADPLGLRDARERHRLISNSHLASTPAARCNPRTPTRRKQDTGMAP
jgi:hypothetical protein